MTPAEPLAALLGAVRAAGVRWAFVGAAARNAWAPPRLTTDIDLGVVADAGAFARLVDAVCALGYRVVRTAGAEPDDAVPAVAVLRNEGAEPPCRQVDLLVAGTDFEREAIGRAVERPIAGTLAFVITREDLLVYKLIAWRTRDRQDVADVLATAHAAGETLDLAYVRRWAEAWDVVDRLEVALAEPQE